MQRFSNIVDLTWRASGDFALSETGDISDTRTSEEKYRGFSQMVRAVLEASPGDWALQNIGAGAMRIAGMPNTPETGAFLERLLKSELVKYDLLRTGEFTVEVIPISKEALLAAISVFPPGSNQRLLFTFSYDLRTNKVGRP